MMTIQDLIASGKYKRCSRCDWPRPLTGYHRNRTKPDQRTNTCRPCRKLIDRIARQRRKAEWLSLSVTERRRYLRRKDYLDRAIRAGHWTVWEISQYVYRVEGVYPGADLIRALLVEAMKRGEIVQRNGLYRLVCAA